MSNEVAVVRFNNGDIFYTAYHGASSAINYVLVPTEEEVLKDPFPDPEWDAWACKPDPKESLEEFYRRFNDITYPDDEDVEVYTPYASGLFWTARGSRIALRVTGGFSDDDSKEGCPDWAAGIIKSTGMKIT